MDGMYSYVARRLILLVPVLFGVSLISFSLMHLIPGDPARAMLGEKASLAEVERLREELGLNDPLYVQYFRYVSRLLHLDLGRSIITHLPVSEELFQRFPATLELTAAGITIAALIGVVTGVVSATHRNTVLDHFARVLALLGLSMPVFWLGIMLILVFSYWFGWFPISGRLDIYLAPPPRVTGLYIVDSMLSGNMETLKSSVKHLVLPAIALGTSSAAVISRMTRSSMLEVLGQDYIVAARSKGLAERVVIYKHALRNALIPTITIVGLQTGALLGGAVLTETVFSWPGMGRRSVEAIYQRDFPIVQGFILFAAFIFVLVNLLVDLVYAYLDPRIRYR